MSLNLIQGSGYCYFIGSDGVTEYGLTLNGYVPIPMTEWVAQMQAAYQASFGPNINLSANMPDGQRIAIESEMLTLISELDKANYDAKFPDTAQGQSLSNVCSITNTTPLPATFSNVIATVAGTPGTVIPDSFQASVSGAPTSVFQVLAGQAYTVGANGFINIVMIATTTGPTICALGDLNVIVTSVSGISSISNAAAGNVGSNLETEAQIRKRRILGLYQLGPAVAQIVSALLNTAGVTNCGGSENDTQLTNTNGLPPFSIGILVQGPISAQAIGTIIAANKAGGIQTYGNQSVVITDSQGVQHQINYSVPAQVQTYYAVNVTPATNSLDGIFPNNGATAIQTAIINYISGLIVGQDVVLPQLQQYIISQVPGIVAITIQAGLAPSPTQTANLSMAYNQLAITAVANISVVA